MKVLHVLLGLDSGGAERIAASPIGAALSLYPRGLAQRAPALDEHEGLY